MTDSAQWNPQLYALDAGSFDRALAQLRRGQPVAVESGVPVAQFAIQLKNTEGISRREYDRRLRLVVLAVTASGQLKIEDVASSLRDAAPDALNVVRTLLPADAKHLAVQRRSDTESLATAEGSVAKVIANLSVASPEVSSDSKHSAVILIGTTEEHVRNEAELRNAKLTPLRLPSLEQFWDVVSTGLCGFVVGASAWAKVPHTEQRETVKRLCEISTFLFSRICLDGLAAENAISFVDDAIAARCGPLDARRFCHGQDCDLTLADIQVLKATAHLLAESGKSNFFPLGLSESDTALLRLIAADRQQRDEPLSIRKLGTREMPGGRSNARVFLLSDGNTQPFVAKVDKLEELVTELTRYSQYIANWESITTPALHSHQTSAAISYRLQAAADGNNQPAPTLEDSLERLIAEEWTADFESTKVKAQDLFVATSRAIDRLVALNSKPSGHPQAKDEFWLDWPMQNLATNGINTEIVTADWNTFDLSTVVSKAMSYLRPNLVRAIVHGDVHGRNIVLRDRVPAFIDFRWSGPGHPLVDLVRLDAAVRTIAMRMLLPKQSMTATFEQIMVEGFSAEQILSGRPELAASPLTTLAVQVAVKCREASMEVAAAHSLKLEDYLAMTCVVSAHMLTVHNLGSGIERLILSILAPRL